jgi:hypothetical protein
VERQNDSNLAKPIRVPQSATAERESSLRQAFEKIDAKMVEESL